uniref:Glycine N-acyltransferase-like protein n=2 Tax=Acrobeloides nanus TaxID=290746 RepID=A0A914CAH6_9BILA
MLKLLSTEQDLKNALEATKDFPAFVLIHHSIRNKLANRCPETSFNVFLHENLSGNKLWIVYRYNPWTVPLAIFGSKIGENFDKKSLFDAFYEFSKFYPQAFENPTLYVAHEFLIKLLKEWLKETFPKWYDEIVLYPTHFFYMTEEQKQKILDLENKLPDGYRFAEVDFEKDDIEIITKTWRHHRPGDFENTKAKIRNMPYSLIKDETGFPIAYEMTDSSAICTHQYVHPDHRRKGLGNAVERDLCQKCIRLGITPNKTVETFNKEVLDASNRSPYWTRWEHDGNPVELMWTIREPKNEDHN